MPDRIEHAGNADRACECPEQGGMIRHQRATCTDPIVGRLNWYADTAAALDRVRALAGSWAGTEGDRLHAEVTRRAGQALLSQLDDDGYPAEVVLGAIRTTAESWMSPGNSFTWPTGGLAVLNVISGETRRKAWYEDFAVTGRDGDGYAILTHLPTGGLFRIVPVEGK